MVAQDIPAQDVGLAAAQAGHDGGHVAVHDARVAVAGGSALVQAGGRRALDHDEGGRVIGIQVGEVAHHGAGERTHASLDKHVRRAVDGHLAQLLGSLGSHGAVALHDPRRNLLVALPGGILNDDAALAGIGLGGGHAHALVVVDLFDGHRGALGGDVIEAGLGGTLGHVHDGLLAQLVGSPCHAAAMVAVGGGKEGGLAKVLGKLIGGQVIEGALGNVLAGLVGNVVGHGKRTAQDLKGVEAKAIALVLNAQVGQAQARGLAIQAGKRSDGVLGERLVEGAGLLHVVETHDSQVLVIALGHRVARPLDLIGHTVNSLSPLLPAPAYAFQPIPIHATELLCGCQTKSLLALFYHTF